MADHGEFTNYTDAILWARTGQYDRAPVAARACRLCGAVVVDEDLHDVWHGRLESHT